MKPKMHAEHNYGSSSSRQTSLLWFDPLAGFSLPAANWA
jgi:hypothetical protein